MIELLILPVILAIILVPIYYRPSGWVSCEMCGLNHALMNPGDNGVVCVHCRSQGGFTPGYFSCTICTYKRETHLLHHPSGACYRCFFNARRVLKR